GGSVSNMRRKLPSQSYLQEAFRYDPETGDLFWRERPLSHFTSEVSRKRFNTRRSGQLAGRQRRDGYSSVIVSMVDLMTHRVVWKLLHGDEPENLDHINGVRSDNRIAN